MSKIPHHVDTTIDGVELYGATVGMSGSATALSCSLIFSTQMHTAVSGTSPGVVTVVLPSAYSYSRMVAWGADLIGGSTSSFNLGGPNGGPTTVRDRYYLGKRAYQYPYGSQTVSSSIQSEGLFANPNTSTNVNAALYGGGAAFTFDVSSLKVMVTGNVAAGNISTVSGTAVDPFDASVAPGSPTACITIWALFRKRSR